MAEPTPAQQKQQQQAQQAAQPVDEFELMRRRIRQRGAAQGEEQQRALTRRFAALGQAPSGAAFKIRQQAQESQERVTGEQLQDVNIQQAQVLRQEREAERQRQFAGEQARLGREFQRGERIGAQEFGAEQARLGREFQTSERLGAQTFASAEALAERGFRTDEREAAQSFAAAEAKLGREFTSAEAALARDFAREEAATGREFAAIQNQWNREHETRMQAAGIASNEKISRLDRLLQKRQVEIQDMLAQSQIEQTKAEGVLNTMATFVNSIGPLREAGMNPVQISEVWNELDTGLPNELIADMIAENFEDFRPADPNQANIATGPSAEEIRRQEIAARSTGTGQRNRPTRATTTSNSGNFRGRRT
jgi:hypothetical protein